MSHNIWLYILVMAAVTYLVRVAPLVLIRKEISNKTIRSFLYYVPYVTLAVMTFPAITEATQTPLSGLLALAAGIILAWVGVSLFGVAVVTTIRAPLPSITRSRRLERTTGRVRRYSFCERTICFLPLRMA